MSMRHNHGDRPVAIRQDMSEVAGRLGRFFGRWTARALVIVIIIYIARSMP